MKSAISFFLLSLIFTTLTAQPATLDSSFGTNGSVVENLSTPYKYIIDAALQADGKTVVLAEADYDLVTRVILLRYNTNGTMDSSFSDNGIADSLIATDVDCYPSAIKLQPDGKILVCGRASDYPEQAFVIRYNPNGSLDPTFAGNGILYVPAFTVGNTTSTIGVISNLAVLPGGKIMLLSYSYVTSEDLILIRLNSNGMIDSSFGTNGTVWLDVVDAYYPEYTRIEVQSNGKLIIGGIPNIFMPSGFIDFVLVRVNANGTIDNSYGVNGKLLLDVGSAYIDALTDMTLQPDGKILASGIGRNELQIYDYTYVVRVNTNGTLDLSFGTGGKQYLLPATNGFASTEGHIRLQSDGKIVLAGCMLNTNSNYTMAAARLTTAGVPDISFDGDGVALLQPNAYNSYGIVPVPQSDGKIALAGFISNGTAYLATIGKLTATGQTDNTLNVVNAATDIGSGKDAETGMNMLVQPDQTILNIRNAANGFIYNLVISRHLPGGIPDNSYGTMGKTSIDLPGSLTRAYSGSLGNGKLMLAALYGDYVLGNRIALVRVNPNGHPDSSFGINGKKFISVAGTNLLNNIFYASIQPDGKTVILISQTASFPSGDSTFLIRLNADGTFDNTFNNNGKKFLPTYYDNISVQSDGKILFSYSQYMNAVYYSFISRLNVDGSTDLSFNNGNPFAVPFEISKMTTQPDSKILLAAYSTEVARLNTNGGFDTSFGDAGTIVLSNYFSSLSYVHDLLIDSGSILIKGFYTDSAQEYPFLQLACLKNTGHPDSTFGINGTATVPVLKAYANDGPGMALQADGKILLSGWVELPNTSNTSSYSNFAMVRLNNGHLTGGRIYTFTGSGNWSDPANWSGGIAPPTTIPAGCSVVIDPPAGSECIIDINVHVQAGASFMVKAGKQVRLPANLIIQQ